MLVPHNLPALNFPAYQFKVKRASKGTQIFDVSRRKYVALTPEEWVRQHCLHFLINDRGVPASLIASEQQLVYNTLKRRADIVVYSTAAAAPVLMVECKAPEVRLTQLAFDQIARYNMVLNVNFLWVTNGKEHFVCTIDHKTKSFRYLSDVPNFEQMSIAAMP